MFKSVKLQTNDIALRGAWDKLIAWIQRRIEAMLVTNGSGGVLLRGHVVRMSADRAVDLADGSTADNARYAGVATQPSQDGTNVIVRNDNLAFVLFVDAPANGGDAFVSDTPGLASNAQGTVRSKLGKVLDASPYATTGGAYVLLNKCCDPLAG